MTRATARWRWCGVVALAAALWATDAAAVKYLTLQEAIRTFIPAEAKVFKVTKKLEPAQRSRLEADYGWRVKDDEYVFFQGKDASGTLLGTVIIVTEQFGTCFHKYAVGIDPNGKVIESIVVELTCPRSYPINRRAFLSQFAGKKHTDALTIKLDIDGVTEATLSSEAASQAARQAVSLYNVLLGPAEAANPSKEMVAARAKGAAMIQRAIDTGETIAKDGGSAAAQLTP